ncbi:MAG TPA: SHOCT domain-containing protein [Rhizomicrobium sp.]|jgi:putative membrane protein|nr:SHOCT domain-containing protein [Rhizomicrobium sp.]
MLHAFLFWPFFWFPFHGLITLIVIVLILSLIFGRRHHYYYGAPPAPPTPAASRSDALSILEGRYARGEIQREEYLQKKQDLSR